MPMEVGIYTKGQDRPAVERIEIKESTATFIIPCAAEPEEVRLDQNVWVLMEGEGLRRR